nr:MAG TPA: hypothetical protein [Caudoviricetes sp.]
MNLSKVSDFAPSLRSVNEILSFPARSARYATKTWRLGGTLHQHTLAPLDSYSIYLINIGRAYPHILFLKNYAPADYTIRNTF